jgi:hypothetical protein
LFAFNFSVFYVTMARNKRLMEKYEYFSLFLLHEITDYESTEGYNLILKLPFSAEI